MSKKLYIIPISDQCNMDRINNFQIYLGQRLLIYSSLNPFAGGENITEEPGKTRVGIFNVGDVRLITINIHSLYAVHTEINKF